MKNMNPIRLMAFFLAFFLFLGAFSPSVFAADAAEMADVYVVTGLTSEENGWSLEYRYSYDKNGLLAVCDMESGTYQYEYKKDCLKKITVTPKEGSGNSDSEVTNNYYGKKGRLRRIVQTITSAEGKATVTTTKNEYDKEGRLTKKTASTEGVEGETVSSYQYDEDGNLTEMHTQFPDKMSVSMQYTYTKKRGNPKKAVMSIVTELQETSATMLYRYTYENDLMMKKVRLTSGSDSKTVYRYSYQLIQVPQNGLDMVKAQQKAILQNIVL